MKGSIQGVFVDSDGIVEKVSPGADEFKPNVGPYVGDWCQPPNTHAHTPCRRQCCPVTGGGAGRKVGGVGEGMKHE